MEEKNEVSNLVPPDEEWHLMYERWLHIATEELNVLMVHPAYRQAEDLGDYVETIRALLSFAPHSRDDITARVHEETEGKYPAWADGNSVFREQS